MKIQAQLRFLQSFGSRAGILLAATLLSAEKVLAQACPLCKLSLLHSPEGRHMAKAFNDGILFLLAMPYLIGGLMALAIVSVRRRRISRNELEPE